MLTAERYLTLYDRFNGEDAVGTFVETTMDELADVLFCTPRNAKLVLRKLEEEQLISWSPGLGRGHRSRIAFRQKKEPFLLEASRCLVERGDYKQSFELIERFAHGTNVREKFMEWLNGHFGYKKVELEGSIARDILRFPVFRPLFTLDPAEVNYAFDAHIARQIYGRLVQFDEKQAKIVPGIAHTWTSNPSATEWVFYLRKGVLFHDGKELTSEDVAFTYSRLRHGKPNSWILRGLADIEAIGPWVVRFRFDQPNRIFDRFLCTAAACLLPKDLGGKDEEAFWSLPIGCGPFRLHSVSEHGIQLAAHAGYFNGRPYLDGVRIVTMPEECQSAFQDVPEMLHFDSDPNDRKELAPEDNWQRLVQLCNGCTLIAWNLNREGPHRSEAFRRAVRMILNPADLIEELAGERVLPATSFRPEISMATPVGSLDPERVRAALRDSGYDGSPLRLSAPEKYAKDARWIVRRLADWGIRAELVAGALSGACHTDNSTDADMSISGIVFAEDEVCEVEFYEHGDYLVQHYLDPERIAWIRRQLDSALGAETDRERRMILREIEERMRDEASIIFLYHRRLNTYLHPSVRGASLNSLGWLDFKDIWLEAHD